MEYLVSQGHPPDSTMRYTLRQLRLVLDASTRRIQQQTEILNARR